MAYPERPSSGDIEFAEPQSSEESAAAALGISLGIAGAEDVDGRRRTGMGQVLRAIGEALVGDPVERDIQAVFEREVQRIAGMRSGAAS